jgi:hypothetical protein
MPERSAGQYLTYPFFFFSLLNLLYTSPWRSIIFLLRLNIGILPSRNRMKSLEACRSHCATSKEAYNVPYENSVDLHTPLTLPMVVRRGGGWEYIEAAVPLQALSGPQVSMKLRFPDFITTVQDGGNVSALVPAAFTPRKYTCYSFLLEAEPSPVP